MCRSTTPAATLVIDFSLPVAEGGRDSILDVVLASSDSSLSASMVRAAGDLGEPWFAIGIGRMVCAASVGDFPRSLDDEARRDCGLILRCMDVFWVLTIV